jgi:hypothetical protein
MYNYLLHDIPEENWKKFKKLAIDHDISIKDLILILIDKYIKEGEKDGK